MKLESIKRLWKIWQDKPYISISVGGQILPVDKSYVAIALHSRNGAQGVYTFQNDEQGNARATLAANTMAHLSNFPIHDNRQ